MFRNALEPWHLIILVLIIVIVFGASRLPDAARSLGRSMRIFKSEVNQMHDDRSAAAKDTVDGDVVTERRTTTTRTDARGRTTTTDTREASGSSSAATGDDYVVIDGVRYRRETGDGSAPRA